jgi:hypothetical protein
MRKNCHARIAHAQANCDLLQPSQETRKHRNSSTPVQFSTITSRRTIYVAGSTPSAWWENPKGVFNGAPPKDQVVMRLDPEGRVKGLWVFPSGTSKPGELGWVHSVAVDAGGNIYTGGVRDNRPQKFVRVGPAGK